jgi:tRNA dimethylallyltransferase
MERDALYARINRRVDEMIAAGLAEEVQGLLNRGYAEDLKSMQSIGYRHMVGYIKGRLPREEAVRILKRDTRRYAKRQFTWFRADPEIVWFKPHQADDMARSIERYLKNR